MEEAELAARSAGMRYVSDAGPGIRRVRRGTGFSYVGVDGRPVPTDERRRIQAIAIPPAWTGVWICPQPDGHVQATGRDAKGRKQHRYHPDWRRVRDATKYERLVDFGAGLPALRAAVERDLELPGFPRERAVGLVVALLDRTLVRVGNDEYASSNRPSRRGVTLPWVESPPSSGPARRQAGYRLAQSEDRVVIWPSAASGGRQPFALVEPVGQATHVTQAPRAMQVTHVRRAAHLTQVRRAGQVAQVRRAGQVTQVRRWAHVTRFR